MRKGYMIPSNLFTEEELADFTDEELGHLFRAIVHQAQGWDEIPTNREEKRIIKEWQVFDDIAKSRYEASADNGKRGGRPKKKNLEEPSNNLEKPSETQNNQYKDNTNNNTNNRYISIIESYTSNDLVRKAIKDVLSMRKQIKKPMTERALEIMLTKLDTLASTDAERIKVLEQSIEHSWQTVYPIKNRDDKAKIMEHSYEGVKVNDPRKQYKAN